MSEATEFVKAVEKRTSLKIACIEEIAFKMGYVSREKLNKAINNQGKSTYASYLAKL